MARPRRSKASAPAGYGDLYDNDNEKLNSPWDVYREDDPYSDLIEGAGEQADKLLVAVIVLLIALVVYVFVFYKGGCVKTAGKAVVTPVVTPVPAHKGGHPGDGKGGHPGDGKGGHPGHGKGGHPGQHTGGKSTMPPRPKPAHFTSQADLDACGPPPAPSDPTEHIEHTRRRAHFSPGSEKIKGPSRRREFDNVTTGSSCGHEMGELSGYTN